MMLMNRLLVVIALVILNDYQIMALVPKPWHIIDKPDVVYHLIDLDNLVMTTDAKRCFTLTASFNRMLRNVQRSTNTIPVEDESKVDYVQMKFTNMTVKITSDCDEVSGHQWPTSEMNESYTLLLSNGQIDLKSKEVWGSLRAVETLGQLIYKTRNGLHVIRETEIFDHPRFSHRGYLIDTSRHYLSVAKIKEFLDAMEIVKMNVLHWHIIDDQSFPYQVYTYQNLWKEGAFHPVEAVYTQENIADIIEYARARGIRVMVEIDTPGHTESWKGLRNIQTACLDSKGQLTGYGPLNPARDETYDSLKVLFKEVFQTFPDEFIHLGGDEVDPKCWLSNWEIKKFMQDKSIQTGNELQAYYMKEFTKKLDQIGMNKTRVFWEEVFNSGAMPDKKSIVHIWMNQNDYPSKAKSITQNGYRVLVSSPWYLNYISYGNDMEKYYNFDPHSFDGTEEEKSLILGGEACMWGELINDANLISVSWPRGSAVAERLWSDENVKDFNDFNKRAKKLQCYMTKRGLQVGTMQPDYCY